MAKKNKLLYGIGINDADYVTQTYININGEQERLWTCPYYLKWCSMLQRCYSPHFQKTRPTYRGCSVCDEWKYFSNFRKWMITQEWEGRQLDKDFLIECNKLYSEDTCVFIPQKVNKFININGKMRGEYPLGVCSYKQSKKNPYSSRCNDGVGGDRHLGYFPTMEMAHQTYLVKKLEICNNYLVEFKDEPLIMKGLARIKSKIQYHIKTGTELTSF